MKRSFGFVLLALLVFPLLLMGCSGDSPETAEDYVEALLQGDADAAQQVACESFQDRTGELAAYFGQQDIRNLDLKFDIGKGNREEEVIVTGSFDMGPASALQEVKLQEREDTRIIILLEKDGDEWCVADTTEVGDGLLALGDSEPVVSDDVAEDDMTEDDMADEETADED